MVPYEVSDESKAVSEAMLMFLYMLLNKDTIVRRSRKICIPYFFTYKPSYFFRNLDLYRPKTFSTRGFESFRHVVAESLIDFFSLSGVENLWKLCDRLVAKSKSVKQNKL